MKMHWMRGVSRKQKKIIKTAYNLFGYSSIRQIVKERNDLYNEMKKYIDSQHKIINMTQGEFLQMYSRFKTLDKLCRMYLQEQEKTNGYR